MDDDKAQTPGVMKVDVISVPPGPVDGPTQTIILVVLGGVVVAGMLGAAFSTANAAQILGFCGLITVQLFALLQQSRAAVATEKAAVKVAEVKSKLDSTTTATAKTLDTLEKTASATHTLVNSNMGAQLKLTAVALRRLAEISDKPEDADAADAADKLLKEHEDGQATVDKKTADDMASKIVKE